MHSSLQTPNEATSFPDVAGASQLANGSSQAASVAPQSNRHGPDGQLVSRQAELGQLGTAEQLRAKLGNSLLASELVEHLCCPITEVRPCFSSC